MKSSLGKSNNLGIVKILLVFAAYIAIFGCKKENHKEDYTPGSNEYVNTWVLDSLKRYYLWNTSLPDRPDLTSRPQVFFQSVRDKADRFSYLLLPNDASTHISSNRNFGFDYSTVQLLNSGEVIGIVKLVLQDSPASRAGLQRGDYIRRINGQVVTSSNAASLQESILREDHFTLGLTIEKNGIWADTQTIEISRGAILDQPAIGRLIESNGRKIGYIYLQDFNSGLARSLTHTFASFKAAGLTDLILDLRYNSGGQVAEAAGLSALIASGISYNTPFIMYKGNKNGGTKTESLGNAATFDRTMNFDEIMQHNLGLKRVFVLSTAATASASEVIINNLKPYIQVILIGETTRGKDEASFKITDERNPKLIEWEIHPIVYKLFNASGNGGYAAGITPDININELASLPLLPFGDNSDPLLNAALLRITGIGKKSMVPSNIEPFGAFKGKVLTDTRMSAADQSIVFTHR